MSGKAEAAWAELNERQRLEYRRLYPELDLPDTAPARQPGEERS